MFAKQEGEITVIQRAEKGKVFLFGGEIQSCLSLFLLFLFLLPYSSTKEIIFSLTNEDVQGGGF